MQHSHEEEDAIYSGPATIEHQDGHTEDVHVRLWSTERITSRPVLGESQQLPSRRDVIGAQGEILTPLHPFKPMQLATAPQLTLRYDQKRWKIIFSDSRSPRFKAWGEETVA
jgi:hypothetical protein